MSNSIWSRRGFIGMAGGLGTGAWWTSLGFGNDPADSQDGRPKVTKPRATSGDKVSEPAWDERLTITVGPKEGDLVGSTHKVLQAAVDYVARLGGGTVQILPGTFTLRGSVHLRSRVRIVGSGDETILTKLASVTTKLQSDSDWYDQEITLVDGKGSAWERRRKKSRWPTIHSRD